MCQQGVCTACGRPGERCCTGDAFGRVTGQGTAEDDFTCWSGEACPSSVRRHHFQGLPSRLLALVTQLGILQACCGSLLQR